MRGNKKQNWKRGICFQVAKKGEENNSVDN